jgi:replicative DNA helicase
MSYIKNGFGKKKVAPDPSALMAAYSPPQCVESELALLSCMMIWPLERERWGQEMAVNDFYRLHHQSIFTLLCEMNSAETDVDIVTFLTEAKTTGRLEDCGGFSYVTTVFTQDAYQKNAPTYARQIKDAAARREVSEGAAILLQAAQTGASTDDMAAKTEALIKNAPAGLSHGTESAKSILRDLDREIEARSENPDVMLGVQTGFRGIDLQINGLQAPDMIVIAARPSVGKSALVTGMAANIAHGGTPVLIASMEMSKKQVMLRIICADAKLSSHRVKAGRLSADEWDRYNASASKFYDVPLDINDQSCITPNFLRGEIRKTIKKYGRVGVVIVDYLQLMKPDEQLSGRYETITALSIELKAICREFNVPMVILSQLSRAVESRDNKRPMLGDVRESGQIEQDADIVAFIYRENMYDSTRATNKELPRVDALELIPTELIFRKHRNGPVGTVMLDFVEQFALFLDPVDDGF